MRQRLFASVIPVIAVLISALSAPAARAGWGAWRNGAVRSGTVVNPANYTGPSNCSVAPDCVAWLASGCDPLLAGRDPAAFTSIVDVRNLAGSERSIRAMGAFGTWLAGAYYEFWSSACRRVGYVLVDGGARLTIPSDAAWMTVPGQTGPYRWAMW